MKKLPSLNEKKHENNPFVVELKGKMFLQPRANAIIAKGQSIVDTSTGEVIDESVLIGRRKVVDKSQFAKIYASEISLLYELTKTAQNVFLYLIKVMDYDNKSFLSYNTDHKKLGYKSGRMIINGLRELIGKNIIAPAIMPHYYWLNPTIVCKGERFAMYTEYVVGKDGEQIKAEAEVKKQGKKIGKTQPEFVQYKHDKTSKTNPINSKNEELLPNQIMLNFEDENNPF